MKYERTIEKEKYGKFDINCPDYSEEEKKKHLCMVLCGMRKRCYKSSSNCYKNYGGRGIKVCDEWMGKEGQKNFYDWAIRNGYRKGLTIDRINNDGDYTPENCRWATIKTQAYNRSTNSYVTIKGKTQTVAEWADEIGISRGAMQNRLRYGWSEDRLLEPPQVHLNMSKHEMRLEILKLREENKSYRDMIEDGKLLHKICKEGDEVYIIAKQGLDIYSAEKVMIVDFWYSKQDKCLYAIDSDGALHREVYATEQEAENKIKEIYCEKKI